jgi:hypothetical protein
MFIKTIKAVRNSCVLTMWRAVNFICR